MALWLAQLAVPVALLVPTAAWLGAGGDLAAVLRADVGLALGWIGVVVAVASVPGGRTWIARHGAPLGLCCVSLFLSLLAAEALLRLYYHRTLRLPPGTHPPVLRRPHPTRGWVLAPGAAVTEERVDYSVRVRTSSAGLRDVEHVLVPAPGVFRIVVLGDSFMEASQVDLAEAMPRRLERALADRGVEVVNLGVGGYGTAQEYVTLEEEGLAYRPDLVVLAFYAENDVLNNHAGLQRELVGIDTVKSFGRPYGHLDAATGRLEIEYPDVERIRAAAVRGEAAAVPLADRFLVARLARRLLGEPMELTAYDPNVWLGVYLTRFDPALGRRGLDARQYRAMWDEAWAVTSALILETRRRAAERGAGFLLLLVPSRFEVYDPDRAALAVRFPTLAFDRTAPARRLRALGRAHDLDVLDLGPAFRQAAGRGEGPLYHLIDDHHWNPAGHALASRLVAEHLAAHRLVPGEGRTGTLATAGSP